MFVGSRLKIKRVNKHILDLNGLFNTYFKTDFYAFRANDKGDWFHVSLRIHEEIPEDAALIIGDAIHNLRSALDLAICELVAKDTRWCKFPFHPTAEKLISAVTKGAIKVSGPAVVDAIINIIKPYKGGNDLLYALHDADIDDKHRLLIPAVSSVTVPFKTIRYGHFCIDGDESAWTVNRDNTEAKPMDLPDDFQIEYNGEPTFDVTFGEACALGHKPVIPTLHQLSQAVAGVIDELEKAHLGA